MIIQHIKQKILEFLPTERNLVVGLSGGIDSVVLTDALWSLSDELDLSLEVIHVNHQLMAEANDWEQFCKVFCEERGLSFRSIRIAIDRSSPLGIEGAAREERYRIFSESNWTVLVLAHHLDDQVETFFLQLLRGSGVDGLGSMPEFYLSTSISKNIFRPLLGLSRDDLVSYAKERKLRWVDDPSNDSNSMNRNFLRHEILPLLKKRFPSMGQTLNRSIENIATASFMLDKFAERDLIEAVTPDGGIDLNILEKWDDARALNVIRKQIKNLGERPVSKAKLMEIYRQLLTSRQDSNLEIEVGGSVARRFRQTAFFLPSGKDVSDWKWMWRGEEGVQLPDGLGTLVFKVADGDGIPIERVNEHPVSIIFSGSSERFCLGANRPNTELKKIWQDMNLPVWVRRRVPVVESNGTALFVGNLGMNQRMCSDSCSRSLQVSWVR